MTLINKYLVKYSYIGDEEHLKGGHEREHFEVEMKAYTATDAYSQTQIKYLAGDEFLVDEVNPVEETSSDA